MNTTTSKPSSHPSDKSGAADAHPVELARQVANTDKAIRAARQQGANGTPRKQQFTCPVSGVQHG